MRDYLEPAMKYIAKVIPHPTAVKVFVAKRRVFVFGMAAMLVVVTTSALMVTRHFSAADAKIIDDTAKHKTTSLQVTTDTPEVVAGTQTSQTVTNTVSPNGEPSTNVKVNGQQVKLPQNGSVHKTIRTENGTTSLNVTVSGNSTNSNTSSVSTNMQVMSNNVRINQNYRSP